MGTDIIHLFIYLFIFSLEWGLYSYSYACIVLYDDLSALKIDLALSKTTAAHKADHV